MKEEMQIARKKAIVPGAAFYCKTAKSLVLVLADKNPHHVTVYHVTPNGSWVKKFFRERLLTVNGFGDYTYEQVGWANNTR